MASANPVPWQPHFCCAALLWLAILALPAGASCPQPVLSALGPGVFVVAGQPDAPRRANCGRTANTGVIVGSSGVIVIDPGPNDRQSRALLRAIRALTPLPVAAVINTHAHPENVLGNSLWRGGRVPILASDATAQSMRTRCRECLATLRRRVGARAMRGTHIVLPNRLLAASSELELGGRRVHALRFEHAHTAGDLAVLDSASGVLFAGGLANAQVIPDLREAHLGGWIAALAELRGHDARVVVPGHGAQSGAQALAWTQEYLVMLRDAVQREVAAGTDLPTALERLHLEGYRGAADYARRHLLNVQHAYTELEQIEFDR